MPQDSLPEHLSHRHAHGARHGEPIAQFEIGPHRNFVYLVIDWETHVSWIVDPQADLNPIRDTIREHSLELGGILLTHTHHDHIAGVPELVRTTPGIRLLVGEKDLHRLKESILRSARVETVTDHQRIVAGSLTLEALLTPGHSAGEVCYFLPSSNGRPPFLLTGDTVFIRDCGRTDFPDSSNEQMFASLQKIRTLPPTTVILPGHHYQPECATTLARELHESPPFQCRSEDELAALP